MTEPASARAVRSREKLLRAATTLLVDSGPRAVTVDAVAEVSGVAKSTLYRHWSSRDEMLVDVVRCNMPDITAPDLSAGFDIALREYLHDAAAAVGDPEWSRILPALMSLRTSMPDLAATVDADRVDKTAALVGILDLGVREGRLPESIDVDVASKLLFGPLLFAAITGDQGDIHQLADHVVDRFVASYRT
ncbi:MAG: TetR/AcrR family transcriptional regulator [Ilumatobacteraceae bacterium]